MRWQLLVAANWWQAAIWQSRLSARALRFQAAKLAIEMALTGDTIDAATAERWGFINRCVPHDELDAATLDLITRASRGSALSMAAGKAAYYRQIDMPQHQAYEFASAVMSEATLTRDAQEGIAAFFEKRTAGYVQKASDLKSAFKTF
jgi:enoyl-CoA hydratase/carnithine racemase